MNFFAFPRVAVFTILLLPLFALSIGAQPAPATGGGAEITIPTVGFQGEAVTFIAIPTFASTGNTGGISPASFSEIIYNDLEIFSDFKRAPNQQFVEDTHRRDTAANQVDFTEWQRLGANFVLKASFSVPANTIRAEVVLYNADKQDRVFGLIYSDFPVSNPRKLAHRISDDIVKNVLNDVGIADTKIVFVSARASAQVKELFVMDADGHNQRQLTRDNSLALTPCWGLDNQEIYFTSYRDRYPDLCGVMVNSGAVWYISTRPGGNYAPSWNQATQRIACFLGKDGNSEIYTMDRGGKKPSLQRLTTGPAIDSSPSFSPDGSQIAFTSDRSGAPHIWVMNADGSGARRLTTMGSYNESASWSPKGDKIAFEGRDRGVFDIYTINVNGTGWAQCTGGQGTRNDDPSWAADGKHLVFSSNRSGRPQIYIMRADGKKQTQLTREGLLNESPAWSPVLGK